MFCPNEVKHKLGGGTRCKPQLKQNNCNDDDDDKNKKYQQKITQKLNNKKIIQFIII